VAGGGRGRAERRHVVDSVPELNARRQLPGQEVQREEAEDPGETRRRGDSL